MKDNLKLEHALNDLARHYGECARRLEELDGAFGGRSSMIEASDRLTEVLCSIEVRQQEHADVLKTWRQPGFAPSANLRSLKQIAQAALESLLAIVHRLEEKARTSKSQLIPQLDAAAKDRQARDAYQRVTLET